MGCPGHTVSISQAEFEQVNYHKILGVVMDHEINFVDKFCGNISKDLVCHIKSRSTLERKKTLL